jgi:hypothetical protein
MLPENTRHPCRSHRGSAADVRRIAFSSLLGAALAVALVGCGALPASGPTPTPSVTLTPSLVPGDTGGGAGGGGGGTGGGGTGGGGGGGSTGGGGTGQETINVPDVVGMTVDEARKTLEDAGFEVVVGPTVDSTAATEIVVLQSPSAGKVAPGTAVTIRPSKSSTDLGPSPDPDPSQSPDPSQGPGPGNGPGNIDNGPGTHSTQPPLRSDELRKDDIFPPVCRVKPTLPGC